MSRRATKYLGALAKPIDSLNQEGFADIHAAVRDQIGKKIKLLITHFGIDRTQSPEQICWKLALSLAFEHVPGFQFVVPRRKGRKSKWTVDECRALVAAIDAHKKNKGLKVAIRMAMKRNDWKWASNVPSIEVRYYEAVRQIKRDELVRNQPYSWAALEALSKTYKPRKKHTTKTPS